ncbi:MAG: very short patch repair endonuclease [Bacteroidales bacterium]|nr:very short patch repair endonuclease [Bacteroidales bacterium]
MTDRMTAEQRHRCMSHIHSKGTKPEMAVRRWLWGHGYRYRLNVRSVPGSPDIVMRRYRTAIFVNGCFWHGHRVTGDATGALVNSHCCKIPQTNRPFWEAKIKRNRERDERNYRELQEHGWQVIVVWECQLKPAEQLERTMREVEVLLNEGLLAIYKHPARPYGEKQDSPLPKAAEETTSYGN